MKKAINEIVDENVPRCYEHVERINANILEKNVLINVMKERHEE